MTDDDYRPDPDTTGGCAELWEYTAEQRRTDTDTEESDGDTDSE